jgi:hypothetical protein
MPILFAALRTKRPGISDPDLVSKWMSQYVHFQRAALLSNHTAAGDRHLCHADGYAAVAYVGWACAAIAEVALGYDDIATWPERWPDVLPWDREPLDIKF